MTDDFLPADQQQIVSRLIEDSIGRGHDAKGQVDGLLTLVEASRAVLDETIGSIASTAVLRRAIYLAGRQHPILASVVVTEGGLEVARLRAGLATEDAGRAREALLAVANSLFAVLYGLLRSALLPILVEIEKALGDRLAAPGGRESDSSGQRSTRGQRGTSGGKVVRWRKKKG